MLHEIVSTGFNNFVMPLIRYRTGDYAVLSRDQKCRCGRNYLLIDEVIGREQEFIITKNGSLISATSLIFGQHYKIFESIESIRIVQEKIGEIDIVIVKGNTFCEEALSEMQMIMEVLLKDKIKISIKFSKTILKSSIGKAKLVEQKLNIKDYID